MNSQSASRFLDQLINDPQLRREFREDPEGTLIQAGLELNEHDRETLAGTDWNRVPDQELSQRVSKSISWSDSRLKQDVATLQGSLAKLRTLYGS